MIPKLIHFIWIGDALPHKYKENIDNIRELNKSFEIKVWYKEDFYKENIQDVIKDCIKNLYESKIVSHRVHASNFLRFYLLYKYGGWYIDTDTIGIKSLDIIYDAYDLSKYEIIVPEVLHNTFIKHNTCLVSSIKKSKISQKLFEVSFSRIVKCNLKIFNKIIDENKSKVLSLHYEYFTPYSHDNITEKTILFHTHDANWKDDKKFLNYK